MIEPKTGIELRLAVARALGQTEPPEKTKYGWEQHPDGTWTYPEWHPWTRTLETREWPLHYEVDANLALEAWQQAVGDRRVNLSIHISRDGATAHVIDMEMARVIPLDERATVAAAVCRALVAWHKSKEADCEER